MKRIWAPDELVEQFTLTPPERDLLGNKTGATRLGFAVLLKAFQLDGRFPARRSDVPPTVVRYIAQQVDVPAHAYRQYDWHGRSISQHRSQIRAFLQVREITRDDEANLVAWLCDYAQMNDTTVDGLLAEALARCRMLHLEPPAMPHLERLVRSALRQAEAQLYTRIMQRLHPDVQSRLDDLITHPPGDAPDMSATDDSTTAPIPWHRLKADPGPLSLESVLQEVAKLQTLRQLGLPADLFVDASTRMRTRLRQRGAAETAAELRRHSAPLRLSLLAAVCWQRQGEITDSLADLLIGLIHRITIRAERRVNKILLSEVKRVAGKTALLYRIAEAAVEHPEQTVEQAIYPAAGGKQTLNDLIAEHKASGDYRQQVYTRVRASYQSHVRRMVPPILSILTFRSNNDRHRPLIRALTLLTTYRESKHITYDLDDDVPIDGVVRPGMRDLIWEAPDRDGNQRINRIAYEICALQTLRDKLRCKEVWIEGAIRYRNPDDDLPHDFATHRERYYAALQQPQDADVFVRDLQATMHTALATLDAGLPTNPVVTLRETGKKRIKLTPLEEQPEPVMLRRLKWEVAQRWGVISLLDILKETDLLVGFTDQFKIVTGRETLDRTTLQKRLLLGIYGLETNIGLKRIGAGDHGVSYNDLLYIRRRFLQRDALRQAITQIVNAIFAARQTHIWGEATTACASDSKELEQTNGVLLTRPWREQTLSTCQRGWEVLSYTTEFPEGRNVEASGTHTTSLSDA